MLLLPFSAPAVEAAQSYSVVFCNYTGKGKIWLAQRYLRCRSRERRRARLVGTRGRPVFDIRPFAGQLRGEHLGLVRL